MVSRIRISAWIVLAAVAGCAGTPAATETAGPRVAEIEYRTMDGITISATLAIPARADERPGPPPLAVLSHQRDRDRASWDPLTGPLVRAGYAVLVPDLRSMGKSTREIASPAELSDADKTGFHLDLLAGIDAAAREAATRGVAIDTSRVALVAAGFSAVPAGQVAVERTSVRALVLLSGKLLPPEEIALASRPDVALLFALASADRQSSVALRRQAEHLSGPRTAFHELGPAVPGGPAWTGTDGLTEHTGLAELIVWFLERHVPPVSPAVRQ